MLIAIPYFGDLARFRPLLDAWFSAYAKTGLDLADVVILSDTPDAAHAAEAWGARFILLDLSDMIEVMRPGQPFDRKGALVCAYLRHRRESTLVMDADAILLADPRPMLRRFAECAVAMPIDAGAIVYFRRDTLEGVYSHVRKMCAGVMFFGAGGDRRQLVANYRRTFAELREVIPWHPRLPHLLEQYTWAVVHHRLSGPTLPIALNWNERHLGELPGAIVIHDYGHEKWEGRKAPANS